MSDNKIHVFRTPETLSIFLAEKVLNLIKDSIIQQESFNIAVSGGKTPRIMFDHIAANYRDPSHWDRVYFYFVDERCVPPTDPESNYKMVYETLLRYLSIPLENIHRIQGEDDPVKEAIRYEKLLIDQVPKQNDIPCFDLILLGIGTDGHIASIFPHQLDLFYSPELCDVGTHPETGQQRVTLTGQVINNAKNIFIVATGKEKSTVLCKIFEKGERTKYPAGLVSTAHGILEWFLDSEAARYLTK